VSSSSRFAARPVGAASAALARAWTAGQQAHAVRRHRAHRVDLLGVEARDVLVDVLRFAERLRCCDESRDAFGERLLGHRVAGERQLRLRPVVVE